MSKHTAIQKLESQYLKKDLPDFYVGDTVRVHTLIVEGDKQRVQMFTGTVIGRSGAGASETMSLHRVAYGEGMERVFMIHSPRIAKIEIVKEGRVRRAKLYYLRGTSGKKAKVRGRAVSRKGFNGASVESTATAEMTNDVVSAEPVTNERNDG